MIDRHVRDASLLKLGENLPTYPLLSQLLKHTDAWTENRWRQDDAYVMEDTQSVMFRWAPENSFASVRDSADVVDVPQPEALTAVLAPVLKAFTQLTEATELGRVFAVRLCPGGRVFPHADVGLYPDTFERFHVCLGAPAEFTYFVQHPKGAVDLCSMRAGELWWFNHKRTHWAHNGGNSERFTLIVDARAAKYRRRRDLLAVGGGGLHAGI